MTEKLGRLRETLREMRRVLVAFSGGVDSSFLLRVAADELGPEVVALTTRSPTGVAEDHAMAAALAGALGVAHVVVEADELAIPGYAANPPDRCYLCKDHLYALCAAEAGRRGIAVVADGVNADDLRDYRPGLQAAARHGVRHPLAEAGLTKAEIRALGRDLGLPAWDRPASPCLSSRFPYGTAITPEALARVAGGERVLHALGFRECRVRCHDTVARIEVPADAIARLLEPGVRATVVRAFRALGFPYVTVDLQGFRSGSLNEVLPGR